MGSLGISLVLVEIILFGWAVSLEGIEAPQPTPFSTALGWGSGAAVVVGLVLMIAAVVRLL